MSQTQAPEGEDLYPEDAVDMTGPGSRRMDIPYSTLVAEENQVASLRAAYEDDMRHRVAALEAQVDLLRKLVLSELRDK